MNCNQYREWISADLDGMLDEEQARRLHEHLADCPACRQVQADLEKTVGLIRALPEVEPPPGLAASIQQRLAAPPEPRRSAWQILVLPQTRLALAAALLMIVVIYGYQPISLFTRLRHEAPDLGTGKNGGPTAAESERSRGGGYAAVPPGFTREMRMDGKDKAQADGRVALQGKPDIAAEAKSRAPAVEQEAVTVPVATHPRPLQGGEGDSIVSQRGKPSASVPLPGGVRGGSVPGVAAGKDLDGDHSDTQRRTLVSASEKQTDSGAPGPVVNRPTAVLSKTAALPADGRRKEAKHLEVAEEPAVAASLPATPAAVQPKLGAAEKAEDSAKASQAGAGGGEQFKSEMAREPGVRMSVIAADPEAVVKVLAPYRRMDPAVPAEKEPLATDRFDAPQPLPAAQPTAMPQETGAKEMAARPGKGEEKDKLEAVQPTETLVTVWVPAGDYPELLQKIKLLGDTTEDLPPADTSRLGVEGDRRGGARSAELIPVQVRIRKR